MQMILFQLDTRRFPYGKQIQRPKLIRQIGIYRWGVGILDLKILESR